MGSCWGVGAARPRPWRHPPRWFPASSGRGRRDATRLGANGDPGQDRSIQLGLLGVLDAFGVLGELDLPVDMLFAWTRADGLVPESSQKRDHQGADRAKNQETTDGVSETHQSELTPGACRARVVRGPLQPPRVAPARGAWRSARESQI